MVLTVGELRITNVAKIDEPTVRIDYTAVLDARPGRGGEWTAAMAHLVESEPQWDTYGAGLGDPDVVTQAGDGTSDTVLWPLESAVADAGITLISDYSSQGGSPARVAMAVSEPLQIYEDVPQIIARKHFLLVNELDNPSPGVLQPFVRLYYSWGNDTTVANEWYEHIDMWEGEAGGIGVVAAEALACALIDASDQNTVLLTFRQDAAGDVYCVPITIPLENRNYMSHSKAGNGSVRYPTEYPIMEAGSPVVVATGGMAGERTGWVAQGFEGGDIFFNSLHAVSVGDDRVLLLHLESTGDVTARIVTYSNGIIVTTAPVTVSTGALNLYQAIPATWGKLDGVASQVAFSTRTAGGGNVHVLDCSGTPAVTGTAALSTDYSHVGWCGTRLAVLTRDGYSAPHANGLGFGDAATDIVLYDPATMELKATIDADDGVPSAIQQVGTISGFADGRLFMHCSSWDTTAGDYRVGHSYAYTGAGIRLWVVENDVPRLQDQVNEPDQIQPASHLVLRWGPGSDVVVTIGPTGESYGGPPGDEAPIWLSWFLGGVWKEGSSDSQPYRISDNWLAVVVPEKNGVWHTEPVETANVREISSMYVTAIHLDAAGVPDIAGEPAWLMAHGSWYSSVCRTSDTRFFFVGTAATVDDVLDLDADAPDHGVFVVLDINETTGALTEAFRAVNHPGLLGVQYPDRGVGWVARILQVSDTSNRYLMLYVDNHDPTVPTGAPLRLRVFDLNDDFSITVLDDQIIDDDPDGGPFTERKPYELVQLTETKYIATWIYDNVDDEHYSGHRGILIDPDGQITLGTTLPGTDEAYGIQGVWFHAGCALGDGRYVYPTGDFWPSIDRYPLIESEIVPGYFIQQKTPFAVMVMDVDDTTGDITYGYYPCKVDPEAIDTDWYTANEFFAPDPQPLSVPVTQRIYQAHPDGALYQFWNTTQCFPGLRNEQFWMFQGPYPVPWIVSGNSVLDGMSIALWTIDDDTETAWFVPDNWDIFAIPAWVSYRNGGVVMRRGLFACLSTTYYHSRGAPQGWDAGFDGNKLRVWNAGTPRGVTDVGPQIVRVSQEGRAT